MTSTENGIFSEIVNKSRLTQREKDENDHQWYKSYSDMLDKHSFASDRLFITDSGNLGDFNRNKINYDLFNNILDLKDLEYVTKPFGAGLGELPANMTNRDITSGKIKALLGMEMSLPFSWKVVATNKEATTRKEQQETQMIKDFVIGEIMNPIRKQIAKEKMGATKEGGKLTEQERQQLEQEIDEETRSRTPDEARKYMSREHQDPCEILARDLLQYLIIKKNLKDVFNRGFKHMMLSGKEVFLKTSFNGEPEGICVNPLFFDHHQSPELPYIEDGAWAVAEYSMSPAQIVEQFGSQLTEDEIDRIYDRNLALSGLSDNTFSFSQNGSVQDGMNLSVRHFTWKALMKVGFLIFFSRKTGQVEEMVVNEDYKLNRKAGDMEIEWLWIPEVHECWKIMQDIYVFARPVPGQDKDLDNLWECKLPYYGASIDNMNSRITAPMERMKAFQYYYNIILYRVELLMASDKGKIIAMNIKALPKSAGIDTAKWTYFMEANHIAWVDPTVEGNRLTGNGGIGDMVKEIDMSTVRQIDGYIKLAEYIERKCGSAIGVTPQMEAQISPNEAVTNTKQNLIQSSYITRPYFDLHNQVKRNFLQALIEEAKTTYSQSKPQKLWYVLDDMSVHMLTTDPDLLESSTYGVFVSDSSKSEEMKNAIINLSQAALQNQQATLLDIAKIIRADSVTEAEELLEVSAMKAQEREDAMEKQKLQVEKEKMAREDQRQKDEWEHEERMLMIKEIQERKTKLQVEAMAALGYDPNKDEDADSEPDVIEIYKNGVDAEIKRTKSQIDKDKLSLEQDKFSHQQDMDEHQKKIDNEYVKIDKKKASKPASVK